ncbi:MAG: hypothetical protein JW934_11255 [Anaerolineae bacterium]|nr:hypothetical protein [Anaerolineae bacterium]
MKAHFFGREWNQHLVGRGAIEPAGQVERDGQSIYFVNVDTMSRQVTNAQIDDYQGLPRQRFLWRPPLVLTVHARFSHPPGSLSGTAGFGFWNDPFMMTGLRLPTLPRAIWFFYASPPSDMRLALDVPGRDWKAATVDALRLPFFLLAPFAPLAMLLVNLRPLYRALWPRYQRSMGVREAAVDVDMTGWHTYVIEWGNQESQFLVDGEAVLKNAPSPRGPLGFVLWLDNQYLVATPWGRFRYGWLGAPGRQWMEVDDLKIKEG